MLLKLEEVSRRIKDLEDFMSGSATSTDLTVDTLDRISKVLKVKALVKKEKIGPFPTEWKIYFDSSYNYHYGYGSDKGMIRIEYQQKNKFDGHVSTFKGNDIDAMEVLLEEGNRLLLAALIS